ncbi:MAG TPA: glycosyltransferase [Candidatus Sulfotelmatobacter sp.]|nr:glycosyltransferase [Candidatus Sulfotelmatobacter sp.]
MSKPQPGHNLHVLTLTPFYPRASDDGAGCFVYDPLSWLARLGIRHTVFAIQPFYRGKARSEALQIPARWFRYFSLPRGVGLPTAGVFAFAQIVGQVRSLHEHQPIDIIHAHGALPCGHAAMLLSRELQIPFVVSVHGLDVFSTVQVGGYSGKWCRRISARTYSASRRVICISERVREEVLQGLGRNCRTSVVYNGVDPDLFCPVPNLSSDEMIVLSVGNLIPVKGHEVLMRSVASLQGEFQKLVLEIIGSGPEGQRLQTLAERLGIAARVRFLGVQPRKRVAAAMQRCAVFALPSRYEGLGCVYLEAMSSAKPAVGCRGQGIAEIIQQGLNGFLVGPDNEKELSLVLSLLLRDENRRRNLGVAARDTILDRFTLAHQADRLARIYRECVE